MTAHDIIKTAFSLMYEDVEIDKAAARFSMDVLNVLLADCFESEQNYREANELPLLTDVPQVSAPTDDVPYNYKLTRIALPYGIAWKYAEENLNQQQAELYRMRYEEARHIAGGGAWQR